MNDIFWSAVQIIIAGGLCWTTGYYAGTTAAALVVMRDRDGRREFAAVTE